MGPRCSGVKMVVAPRSAQGQSATDKRGVPSLHNGPLAVHRYRANRANRGNHAGDDGSMGDESDILAQTLSALDHVQEWGNVGLWEVDLRTNHSYWSTQFFEIVGMREASLEGFMEHVHPDDRHLVDHVAERVCVQPGPYRVDHRFLRDGEVRHLGHRLQSIAGDDGVPSRVIGVMTDVTALRQVEDQMSSAVSARNVGLLASAHVHGFKNQLAVIMGHTALITAAMDRGELPDRGSIDAIARAATTGHDLVREILDLGRSDDSTTSVDPQAFMDRVVALSAAIVDPGVEVISEVSTSGREIVAPLRRLEQAVLDLVMNAADAIGTHGRLELRWEEGANREFGLDRGVLSIVDSGAGMDSETLQRVCEPFFTTKDPGKGSGIGLASARMMAEHAGGSLEVDSVVGEGTTIRIELPLSPEGGERNGRGVRPRARRIVVVDAVEARRDEISAMLADVSRQIVAVATVAEAARHLATEPVDVIVVGEMAGPRAMPSTVPVIEVSTSADRDALRGLVMSALEGGSV